MAPLETMNRQFVLLLWTLLCCVHLSAQGLRTSVCVVYPESTPEDSLILTNMAQQFAQIGFTSDATALRAYAGHPFGSGVLTEQFVLTNRHVVGYAKTVKLVFMLHDKTLTFEHCPVVSTSQMVDLAIIQVPSDLTDLHPLGLSSLEVQDGEDIFAAGFPGLKGEPSWQLSRGSISNVLLNMDGNDYIQHTAAIDPGSSGGPLLRKRDGVFEIIGLNTLKAFQRDRVGMAVSQTDLTEFILAAPNKTDQQLLAQFKDVDISQLMEYYRQLPDSMKTVLHDMEVRLPMDRAIAIANYYGGVAQLQKKTNDHSPLQSQQTDKRLVANKPGIGELRDMWSIYVGYDALQLGDTTTMGWWNQIISLNTEFAPHYFIYGANLIFATANNMHDRYISGSDTIPAMPYTMMGVGFGIRYGFQLPIRLNTRHALVPKVTVDADGIISLGGSDLYLAFPLRVGLDYRYQFKKRALVIGAYYTFVENLRLGYSTHFNQGVNVRMGIAL